MRLNPIEQEVANKRRFRLNTPAEEARIQAGYRIRLQLQVGLMVCEDVVRLFGPNCVPTMYLEK